MPYPDAKYPPTGPLLAALRDAYDALDYAQAQVDSESDRMHLCRVRRRVKPVIDRAEGNADETDCH